MQLRPNFKLIKDWFDLYGDILIDEEVYPFALLFKNIKNGDRFLKIKNGNFVLIPEEVMTKYSQIATFADANSKDWKLSKSHFTLIENADLVPNKTKLTRIDDNVYAPPASLKAILRPYQIEGVKWLINHRKNGLGACLADDMGLGKTVQVIAALLDAKENKPAAQNSTSFGVQLDLFGEIEILGRKSLNALIVLPASLVFNWHRELLTFAPSLQVIQYTGSQRQKAKDTLHTFDVILTTYQTLILDFEIFKQLHLHYMVLDESQQIRNKNSKTFQIIHQIQADHRISLSGTPIENSLSDLWSQMEFLNGSILGRFSFFKENFLNPIEKKKDATAISTLKKIVEPFILRRTKEQVAKDLPALIEMTHYSTMSEFQTLEYERQKSAARNFLAKLDMHSSQFRFHVLSSILRLRQIANHPILADQDYEGDSGKYNDVQDQIKTLTRSGHKVLVFSSFVSHLKLYAEWLNAENVKYEMLTGSSTTEHRKNAVDLFQSDKNVQVFLISIKAGSTGLNLTAADYIFILDPWWNPFVEKQAVARAHRIGRTHKVIVKRFLSKDTIEEKIVQLQGHKTSLSDDILDVDDIPMLKDVELFKLI